MTSVYLYCPLKPPNENAASGVPRIGALFARALAAAGYEVTCPPLPTTHEPAGDAETQSALADAAILAADALVADLRRRHIQPRAWFTYHCYYKAPDVIGPRVARAFGCPYLIAEGSFARKRIGGAWATHQRHAEAALASADILFAATERDRAGLEKVPDRKGGVMAFPPFVDVEPFRTALRPRHNGPARILAAGSMRDERKLASYGRLFKALSHLPVTQYALMIAGDGAARNEIEAQAAMLRRRGVKIELLGQIPPASMPGFFANGDIFAWPGVGEAYGLTYLEAQAAGLPVVAEDHGGVAACVEAGISGFLTQPSAPDDFARALSWLLSDDHARDALGRTAQDWVSRERSLSAAAKTLSKIMQGLGV